MRRGTRTIAIAAVVVLVGGGTALAIGVRSSPPTVPRSRSHPSASTAAARTTQGVAITGAPTPDHVSTVQDVICSGATCVAVGSSPSGDPLMWWSSDGGATFQPSEATIPADVTLNGVTCQEQTCVATGLASAPPPAGTPVAFASTDGGAPSHPPRCPRAREGTGSPARAPSACSPSYRSGRAAWGQSSSRRIPSDPGRSSTCRSPLPHHPQHRPRTSCGRAASPPVPRTAPASSPTRSPRSWPFVRPHRVDTDWTTFGTRRRRDTLCPARRWRALVRDHDLRDPRASLGHHVLPRRRDDEGEHARRRHRSLGIRILGPGPIPRSPRPHLHQSLLHHRIPVEVRARSPVGRARRASHEAS